MKPRDDFRIGPGNPEYDAWQSPVRGPILAALAIIIVLLAALF